MKEAKVELGTGLVKQLTNVNSGTSNLSIMLQDFGLKKNELVGLTIDYKELCEIHDLAKALHESVKKLKQ